MSWTTQAAPSISWSTVTYTEDSAMRSYRTNYVTDSGEPWNPRSWRNGSASTATDGTLAPDGGYGTKLTRVNGNGNSVLQVVSFPSNGTKTFSIHLKAGTASAAYVEYYDTIDGRYQFVTCAFNTTPPGVSFSGSGGGISTVLQSFATVSDGWYRIGLSVGGVVADHINALYLFPDLLSGNGAYTYFWGAQAEDGGSMTTYIPSTDTWGREISSRWEAPTTASESWTTQAAP